MSESTISTSSNNTPNPMPSPREIRQRAIEAVEKLVNQPLTEPWQYEYVAVEYEEAVHFAERALRSEARVQEAEGLLVDMSSSAVAKGTCWCEPSRDIQKSGHMERCQKARLFLSLDMCEGCETEVTTTSDDLGVELCAGCKSVSFLNPTAQEGRE